MMAVVAARALPGTSTNPASDESRGAQSLVAALEEHHDDAFGWALVCCKFVRADAEDVLQHSYLKVLDGRARFKARSTFKTWLFGVIRLTASEHRRREAVRRLFTGRALVDAVMPGTLIASMAAPAPDAADVVESNRARDDVRRALLTLSTRQREVLELVLHRAMTIEDAAVVMGIGVGSARTHYDRGKRALRAALEHTRAEHSGQVSRLTRGAR